MFFYYIEEWRSIFVDVLYVYLTIKWKYAAPSERNLRSESSEIDDARVVE